MNNYRYTEFELNNEENKAIEKIDVNTSLESKQFYKTEEKTERSKSNIKQYVFNENTNKNKKTSKTISKLFLWISLVLIIIVITLGVLMFFVTMPGISMDNLKTYSKKFGVNINNLFFKDSVEVDDQDIYDILDYLVGMGYDLKAFGFLTDNVDRNEDNSLRDDIDDGLLLYTSGDNEGKIKEAKSDFLLCYLISDNYLYSMSSYENSRKKWNKSCY